MLSRFLLVTVRRCCVPVNFELRWFVCAHRDGCLLSKANTVSIHVNNEKFMISKTILALMDATGLRATARADKTCYAAHQCGRGVGSWALSPGWVCVQTKHLAWRSVRDNCSQVPSMSQAWAPACR